MSSENLSMALGSSRGWVAKWEALGCNLKNEESNSEPGLVGHVPRSRFCSQADGPACGGRR